MMKLTVSSISFTTACAVFIKAHSNAVMASVVNAAYENEVEQATDKHSKTRSLGEECSFASSGLRSNDADIGILDCAENFVCDEDERSSLGGRCVSTDTMQHRTLNTCTKCSGSLACVGLSQDFINNKIGDGACCGDFSCKSIDEATVTSIGAGSCIGYSACYQASGGPIGAGSCIGYYPCFRVYGGVGDGSCNAKYACYEACPFIDNNTCNVSSECSYKPCVPTASPMVSASPTLAPTSSAPTNLPTSLAPTNAPISNAPTPGSKTAKKGKGNAAKAGKDSKKN